MSLAGAWACLPLELRRKSTLLTDRRKQNHAD
jgi:hypothetical protein